jgi:PD-(D/E)XK endonuclease
MVGEVLLSILDTAQPKPQANSKTMEHPKAKGDRSTLAIMLALSEAGYKVLVPFGENTRYDLVIDDGASLKRVQCKTGRLRQGAVRFAARSSYAHHPNPKMVVRDYLGQIDFFGIYCPETHGAYLVPVEEAQVRATGSLRVTPARNGQKRRIRVAADYEIGQVAIGPIAGPDASGGACRSSA